MTEQTNPLTLADRSNLAAEIVAWEIKGQTVPLATLTEAIQRAGLDPKYVKDMRPRQAFTRACKDLQDKRVIRILDQDDKEVVFQFNREEQANGQFQFPYECNIVLSKVSGKVSCEDHPQLEEKIQELVNRHVIERTSADITKIVQAMFKDNADLFPLVPSKGSAYLTPVQHMDFVDKVETFMDALGGKLLRYPIPRENRSSVSETIARGLGDLIEELKEATAGFSDSTRQSTAQRHLDRFKSVKAKVWLYADHLKSCQQELLTAISAAESEADQAVNELFKETSNV